MTTQMTNLALFNIYIRHASRWRTSEHKNVALSIVYNTACQFHSAKIPSLHWTTSFHAHFFALIFNEQHASSNRLAIYCVYERVQNCCTVPYSRVQYVEDAFANVNAISWHSLKHAFERGRRLVRGPINDPRLGRTSRFAETSRSQPNPHYCTSKRSFDPSPIFSNANNRNSSNS